MDDVPHAEDVEIDFLLGTRLVLDGPHVARDEVVGSFAGLRPLVAAHTEDQSARTADLSRRHLVDARHQRGRDGGRRQADHLPADGPGHRGLPGPHRRGLPHPLAAADRGGGPRRAGQARRPGRLVRRYGTEATAVAALASEDPALAAPLAPGVGVLGAEVVWALRAEGALTVDDVLERRTRLSLVDRGCAEPRAAP